MIVREAEMKDVEQIVLLAEKYHNKSHLFDGLTFSRDKAVMLAKYQIASEDNLLVAESNNVLVGFLAYGDAAWFCEDKISVEQFLYVDNAKAAVLLVKQWVNNCIDRNVKKMYTSSTAGYGAEAYKKLLLRLGFNTIEGGEFLYYG